ncbi:MAG TPA: pilin [Patescibacteria group bacterium]|nr:pilin [Patescibacteria group bacterium]
MKIAQELQLPGVSPITGPTDLDPELTNIGGVITKLMPLLFSVAGLILFAMFLWGGYDLMFSGGEPQKAESAKAKMTYAVVGFILVFTAYWLTQALGYIFDVNPF